MKKLLLFFILSSSFFILNAQPGYLDYPKANEVYAKFFTTYSASNIPSIQLLQFQKKPDGWHVVQFSGGYDTIVKDELLWSRKTKSFQQINFDAIRFVDENNDNLAAYMKDFKNYYFNFFPYYNYSGFDWDIIQEYGNQKNLPDSILYALGRSYSYFADNLLNNNSGMSDKRFRFTLKEGPNSLSPEQLDKYRKYHNLAVETFKQVKQINPKYVTMVGDIGVKLADEYMVGYLDMLIYQNDEEANKELPDNIYDNFLIAMAKNYLSSCPPNAILLTYGDNDTYPLLYVQGKYKFRTDVLIINNELISVPRYINRMRMPFIGAEPLPMTMAPDQYKDGVRDYLFYYNNPKVHLSDDSYTDLKLVMDFILSADSVNKIALTNGEYVNYLPVNRFKMVVNKDNVIKSKIVSEKESKDMDDNITWKFKDGYLLKGNLIMLDALLANDWKRPICFTNGGDDQYLGLNNYLKLQGLVYELVPIKNSAVEPFFYPTISSGDMYNLIMHTFEWGGISSGKYLCQGEVQMANGIRASVSKLANVLVDENKKDSALKVLNLCMDSIPEKTCPYDYEVKFIDQVYYKAGSYERANSISKKLFKTYEGQVIDLSKQETDATNGASVTVNGYVNTSNLIEEAKIILKDLTRFAKDYNQNTLYKDYLQRLNTLSKKGFIAQDDIDSISAN